MPKHSGVPTRIPKGFVPVSSKEAKSTMERIGELAGDIRKGLEIGIGTLHGQMHLTYFKTKEECEKAGFHNMDTDELGVCWMCGRPDWGRVSGFSEAMKIMYNVTTTAERKPE